MPKKDLSDLERRALNKKLSVTPIPDESSMSVNFMQELDSSLSQARTNSAVTEIKLMSNRLATLITAVNNQADFVRQIPEIKDRVDEADAAAQGAYSKTELVNVELSTKLNGLETRLCLETESLAARMHEFIAAKRNFILAILTFIVFGLTTTGSLIWFLSQLNQEVHTEIRERREGHKRLEKQLEKIEKQTNPVKMLAEIKSISKSVSKRSDFEYNNMCTDANIWQKKQIRRILKGKRVPASCR
ncbi:MAG: hypothetical protein ACXAEU_19810 [Candidatus Hodarchaeales archaeon]|jgi:hypothetical protein